MHRFSVTFETIQVFSKIKKPVRVVRFFMAVKWERDFKLNFFKVLFKKWPKQSIEAMKETENNELNNTASMYLIFMVVHNHDNFASSTYFVLNSYDTHSDITYDSLYKEQKWNAHLNTLLDRKILIEIKARLEVLFVRRLRYPKHLIGIRLRFNFTVFWR